MYVFSTLDEDCDGGGWPTQEPLGVVLQRYIISYVCLSICIVYIVNMCLLILKLNISLG